MLDMVDILRAIYLNVGYCRLYEIQSFHHGRFHGVHDSVSFFLSTLESVCLLAFNKSSRRLDGFLCLWANVAEPSPSLQLLLFCQELLCFPGERKLFHFQLLSLPECERRSFSNIRSFQLPSPS